MENKKKILAFIGSYAESNQPGLYVGSYEESNGSLTVIDEVDGLQNPTFLEVNSDNLKVYALTEGIGSEGQRCGAAAAFEIDPASGKLSLLNKENTVPATTCHITLDHTNQCILVASYHGGMIGLSPLLEDGRVGAITDIQWHKGSSILPDQDRPHAHFVFIDRQNRFVGVCDLGLDRILLYKLDLAAHRLLPHGEVQVAPGSGPRHFAFHPSFAYGYVINELNSTITAFSYDEELGVLTEIQSLSTLPDDFEGENACADIHISPDGNFLYGSNRGHDSIVVYAIDRVTGRLSIVEFAPTLGGHPRNFALSPDGQFMLVANRDANNIVTFKRDESTGKLLPTGSVLSVSKPVCIKFVSIH
ncbi:lactonase family protein [Paenibacillus sp. SYP-B3998]|uniref:Lactonase family protein n=1 Tax=Paenibacillus sp. SYP-B3998 TaxID=2678564 RepID=A0A6G3ZTB3_9BACL|nr:lactonase family protein [Paenibacillus sp. SYP-B3998]NEW04944.1 lactonase family protein [Paenibacillus sp. SYP-B3998]